MPNILINPNSGLMEFTTGTAGTSTFDAGITGGNRAARLSYDNFGGLNLTSYVSNVTGVDRFTVDGANGRLFSVTDNLSGSLFSVNDIAGLPIIEAFDDNTVIMGGFNRNDFVLTGNALGLGGLPNTGTTKLYVSGNVQISGGLFVSGNAVLTGSSTLYATSANLASTGSTLATNLANTGSTLNTKIDNLSGASVLTTTNQNIFGNKRFQDSVYINNLFVTGTETVVSTNNFNVQSPYLILNLTGGAIDGGIFFITGSGLTGINDTGPIIGFDHSNKFKFGISTRNSDLSTLPDIASVQNIQALSGVAVLKFGDQTISGEKTFNNRATKFGNNIIGQVWITDDNYGNDLGIMTDQDEVIAVKMSDGSFRYGGGTPPNAPIRVNSSGTLNVRNDLTFSRDTTITTGIAVSFTKTNYGSQIDYITSNIYMTRGNVGPLYNAFYTDYSKYNNNNYSDIDWINPRYTKWNIDGWNDLTNIRSRQYGDFVTIVSNAVGLSNIVGQELIMQDSLYNQYYLIKFNSWAVGGGGGFSYIRSLVSFNDPIISKISGYLEVAQNATFDSSVNFKGPTLFQNSIDVYGGSRFKGEIDVHYLFSRNTYFGNMSGSATQTYINDQGLIRTKPDSLGEKINFYNTSVGYSIGVENQNFKFIMGNGSTDYLTFNKGPYYESTEVMRINADGDLSTNGSVNAKNLVYNTGNQSIGGNKTFTGVTTFSGQQVNLVDTALNLSGVGDMTFEGTNINFINSPVFISGTNLRVVGDVIGNNLVYNTGNQNISGNKNFYGNILLSGNYTRIGPNHNIEVDGDFVYIKQANDNVILSTEEFSLFDSNEINSVSWADRKLNNRNGAAVLYWTGDNIGIGTNNPSEKLQVIGNILGDNLVYNTGNQTISGIKTFIGNHNISGNTTVSGSINISGNYDIYSQLENAKKLAIAYAIAL